MERNPYIYGLGYYIKKIEKPHQSQRLKIGLLLQRSLIVKSIGIFFYLNNEIIFIELLDSCPIFYLWNITCFINETQFYYESLRKPT